MNCATTRNLQGRYRPAVRRAWETECARHGADPANRIAYDSWYRMQLDRLAGISTTKGADARTLESLIEGFLLLAGDEPAASREPSPESIPRVPVFSPAQQEAFKRLVGKAWRKVQEFDPSVDFAAWFNARTADYELRSPGFSGGNLFDRAMCLFGVIAGDDFWIQRTAEARERRIRHVIRVKLAELSRLTERELDWSYVQGIHDQAKLSHSLDDCPAAYLLSILQMLGSAIARELRR